MSLHRAKAGILSLAAMSLFLALLVPGHVFAAQSSESVGLQGTISSPPPTTGATITIPGNGQRYNETPITVSGICPKDLLVKIFKNNVFAGSVQCNGSFSITIDLFSGQNDIVARVYDSLDQAGPDSNTITVFYNDDRLKFNNRVLLTSDFAKKGSFPGQKLVWPIILSGGTGPYAISVDWGDGKTGTLKPQQFAGTFDMDHVYESPGIYKIIVKATDSTGQTAFLQLVGIANGALSQTQDDKDKDKDAGTIIKVRVVWWPAVALLPFILAAFWLGKRHELQSLKRRLSGRL